MAEEIAYRLTQNRYGVITGGCLGIMKLQRHEKLEIIFFDHFLAQFNVYLFISSMFCLHLTFTYKQKWINIHISTQ